MAATIKVSLTPAWPHSDIIYNPQPGAFCHRCEGGCGAVAMVEVMVAVVVEVVAAG